MPARLGAPRGTGAGRTRGVGSSRRRPSPVAVRLPRCSTIAPGALSRDSPKSTPGIAAQPDLSLPRRNPGRANSGAKRAPTRQARRVILAFAIGVATVLAAIAAWASCAHCTAATDAPKSRCHCRAEQARRHRRHRFDRPSQRDRRGQRTAHASTAPSPPTLEWFGLAGSRRRASPVSCPHLLAGPALLKRHWSGPAGDQRLASRPSASAARLLRRQLGGPGVAPNTARIVHQGGGQLVFVDAGTGRTHANGQPIQPASTHPFDFARSSWLARLRCPTRIRR